MYVNPIPYVDKGKEFEMRLAVTFDNLVEVEEAKLRTAEYIKGLPVEELKQIIVCTDIKAVYPGK